MTQQKLISKLCESNPEAVIISSLGTISYDLKEIDHPKKILLSGTMGCALSCGLGYALGTKEQVIVLIGDGSFLMKMGGMATILKNSPKNLRIVVFYNGTYKSCGGQKNNFDVIKGLVPFEVYEVS